MRFLSNFIGAACIALAGTASADRLSDFIANNAIGYFYHELGHAMIHSDGLVVLGSEEIAADTAVVLLIDRYFERDFARDVVRDIALGFRVAAQGRQPDFSDIHPEPLQRYNHAVCLYYGASPSSRRDFADEMSLPSRRREKCPSEYELARASWNGYLSKFEEKKPSWHPIKYDFNDSSWFKRQIASEIDYINKKMRFPIQVKVVVARCGGENASYSPRRRTITICEEVQDKLKRRGKALGL